MATDTARLATLPKTTRILVRGPARRIAVTDLELSTRLYRTLARHGLTRVGKLHEQTVADLLAYRGFGRTQAWELLDALYARGYLDPRVPFPPVAPLRPRGPRPRRPPSWSMMIRVRPTARGVPFVRCQLSNWLRGTLDVHGVPTVGDLDGLTFGTLRTLRRFGRVQARELFHLLASNDFLEPELRFSFDDPRDKRLAALRTLTPEVARVVLTRGAAPFPVLRHTMLAVAPSARRAKLASLPLPVELTAKLHDRGYARIGDLHGLVLGSLRDGRQPLGRGEIRLLQGVLRAEGALVKVRSSIEVPARWRKVSVDDVPMPNPLYNALVARDIRTLGDMVRLTPERLGKGFGPVREKSLRALLARLEK